MRPRDSLIAANAAIFTFRSCGRNSRMITGRSPMCAWSILWPKNGEDFQAAFMICRASSSGMPFRAARGRYRVVGVRFLDTQQDCF